MMKQRSDLPAEDIRPNLKPVPSTLAEDARLNAVLFALAEARPDEGLETRLLQRLADAPSPKPHSRWQERLRPPRFAVSAAVAATCAVCATALLLHHARYMQSPQHAAKASTPHMGSGNPQLASESGLASSSWTTALPPQHALNLGGHAIEAAHHASADATIRSRNRAARPIEASTTTAREPSFPAPQMPLTEQERLLLQIAHRNDPVQLAMLDPVERELHLMRERAESDKFFAPAPLPPSLQHEIDAALRSQYVNTPPPDQLK